MDRTVAGLFTSAEQANWATRDLKEAGFREADLDTRLLEQGRTLVTVRAGSRETTALDILARHGPESIEKNEGQRVGDISNAPRETDNAPVVTEPVESLHADTTVTLTPEERSPAGRKNLAQATGQYYDMMRSESGDGTVPPTARREAITTPHTTDYDQAVPGARYSTSGAPQVPGGAPPEDILRGPRTPLQEFAARASAEDTPTPDTRGVLKAREMIEPPLSPPPGAPQVQARQSDRLQDSPE